MTEWKNAREAVKMLGWRINPKTLIRWAVAGELKKGKHYFIQPIAKRNKYVFDVEALKGLGK